MKFLKNTFKFTFFWCLVIFNIGSVYAEKEISLKNFSRIEGARENSLVGYGLVVGLSGSGDTSRSKTTKQSIANALAGFGINMNADDINSRNVAAVMVTATLSPFSVEGDTLDVNVSSVGDARNLVGGTLLMTPLKAIDDKVYVIAQGQISTGGYSYEFNGNTVEKNHQTAGIVSGGGRVERALETTVMSENRELNIILDDPSFITADRLQKAMIKKWGAGIAEAIHAGKILVRVPESMNPVSFMAQLENLSIDIDRPARVVVNEKTGTVVSGGEVIIDSITVSHGNLQVIISTEYTASQPNFVKTIGSSGISTVIVPNTQIEVTEDKSSSITLRSGSSIDDLIKALSQIKTSTRDVIGILQAIKQTGALHAELIIQ